MKTASKFHLLLWTLLPLFALAQTPTSYDSDGDGIPDSLDECMYVKGVAAFHGCPYEKKVTPNDRDGDGIANEEDACPDFFGTSTNKGCPEISAGGSFTKASSATDPTAVVSAGSSLFTTTSSGEQSELKDFKDRITLLIADAKNEFSDIKGAPYKRTRDTFSTSLCLPEALDCYVSLGNKKFYYANFGDYESGMRASEKADDIKQKLLMSLGENEWHYSLLGKSGYVEEYQVWKKSTSARYTRIRTYIQKDNDRYNVYLTLEEL